MKRTLLAALAMFAGCAQLVPAPAIEPGPDPAAAWGRVLERYVDDQGRVNFRALASDRADLDRYVAWIYAHPAPSSDRTAVLAYHLNAYNALAMYNVLERGIPASLAGAQKIDFFVLRNVKVGGQALSLYAYENDVIRPLGEERVHFALNCMVRGCPRLPREPFRAENLEAQLDAEARRFLAEPRNVRVDAERRSVHLSELMKFYRDEFLAKEGSLVRYVNRYRTPEIPLDYDIEFIPYDWTVNSQ